MVVSEGHGLNVSSYVGLEPLHAVTATRLQEDRTDTKVINSIEYRAEVE